MNLEGCEKMALSEDDFRAARGLRAAPGLGEDVWRVCEDYRLVKPSREDRRKKPGQDRYLEPAYPIHLKSKWRTVKPLDEPGLVFEFVNAFEQAGKRRDFVEPIIEWTRRYGLLGLGRSRWWHGGRKETIRGYVTEMHRIAGLWRLYEAVLSKDEEAVKAALEECTAAQLYDDVIDERVRGEVMPRNVALRLGADDEWYEMSTLEHATLGYTSAVTRRVGELCRPAGFLPERARGFSKVRTGWSFDNLLGPMYLQLWWLLGAEERIKRCKFPDCNKLIPNPRKNQEFCKDASCRNKYDYRSGRRAERARIKAAGHGTSQALASVRAESPDTN